MNNRNQVAYSLIDILSIIVYKIRFVIIAIIFCSVAYLIYNKLNYTIKELKEICIEKIQHHPELDLEYLEIVSIENLHPIEHYKEDGNNAACIAATISSVRLIDNIIF